MSVGIGLVLSTLLVALKITVPISWAFILIVVCSLAFSKISPKFTCLSYVLAFIYFIDYFCIKMRIKTTFFELSYIEMMDLVGILHLIEGVLTFLMGGKKSQPVITYRGEKIAGGYEAYGKWLIPLLFFSIQGFYVPIVAAVVYMNQSFVMPPQKKARMMGIGIGNFGMIIIGIASLIQMGKLPPTIGMIMMPLLHESLFIVDRQIEKRKLKYTYPYEGIRIMEILGENTLNLERGDIIRAVNEEILYNEERYDRYIEVEKIIKNEEKLALSIEKITGERKKVVCTAAELRGMKRVFLPAC